MFLKSMGLLIAGLASVSAHAWDLPERYVVIPNRGDSSVSILDASTGQLSAKVGEAEVGFRFEPIYASYLGRIGVFTVSDRQNSRLLVFDDSNLAYLGAIPTSQGMFHTWPTPSETHVLAVGDIDNVLDLVKIDKKQGRLVYKKRQFQVPERLSTGKAHDVVTDGDFIYLTVLGVDSAQGKVDYLLKIDFLTLNIVGELVFSEDIHVGLPLQSPYLLVPEQTDGELNLVDRKTFKVVETIGGLDGAHGVYWNPDASRIFLANFDSTGPDSVYEVRRSGFPGSALSIAAKLDLPNSKAHNITGDFRSQLLFVTHSGPDNNRVAIFNLAGTPRYLFSVESGVSPLGALLVERN